MASIRYATVPAMSEPTLVWVTVKDLQRRWRVARSTAYDLVHQPGFPKPLRLGAAIRYRLVDVEQWEASRLDPAPELPPSRRGRAA